MVTYLEFCNNVLTSISEPTVDTVIVSTKPVILKLRNSIATALDELQNYQEWSWMNRIGTLTTWNSSIVTITGLKRLHSIHYKYDDKSYGVPLTPLSSEKFTTIHLHSTDMETSTVSNCPSYWRQLDTEQIQITPFVIPEDESRLIFHYSKIIALPATDVGILTLPDRFITCLQYLVCYHMAVRHVHDMQEAQYYRQLYENLIYSLASQERYAHQDVVNFYGT